MRAPTLKPRLPLLATGAGRAAAPGQAVVRTRGGAWVKIRRAQLQREPLCRECAKHDRTTAAVVVDHIKPLFEGGSDDPDNLQSLCQDCDDIKGAAEHRRRYNLD